MIYTYTNILYILYLVYFIYYIGVIYIYIILHIYIYINTLCVLKYIIYVYIYIYICCIHLWQIYMYINIHIHSSRVSSTKGPQLPTLPPKSTTEFIPKFVRIGESHKPNSRGLKYTPKKTNKIPIMFLLLSSLSTHH